MLEPLQAISDKELRENFPNPAVREVACEIRFAPRLRILPEVWRIQEKLADSHPDIGEERIPQGDGRVLQTYVFSNPASQSLVKVSQENFVVARNRYTTFEDFKADAISLISEFARQFDVTVIQRTGLRYVNHIELPIENTVATLQRYLRAPIDFSRVEVEYIEQFLSEFRLRSGEHKLTVRGALLQLPLPARTSLYILDLDGYDTESRNSGDLETLLDAFHRAIQISFLQHLTEDYKNIMRGKA